LTLPPLSPRPTVDGTRFSVLSRRRPLLRLGDGRTFPAHECHRGWDVFVEGVGAGTEYNWVVDGVTLIDPCCLALAGHRPSLRSVVVAPGEETWERPTTPLGAGLVYELNVRGFTVHTSSGVSAPGTYAGVAERIDHLKALGVTAVELMPVHEFFPFERGRPNFWGYSPVAWLAPHRGYAVADPIAEFRALVHAMHAAGIQVLVDVVFNHTAELDETGPTLHFRGLDEGRFYLEKDRSGCGNTVRTDDAAVRDLILDGLHWWHAGLGVDGFRFDLASILSRGDPSLVDAIDNDPRLADAHLIAEAWDAAGTYEVDAWPGDARWSVWNDRFRDDVRRAWLGHADHAPLIARRLCGSDDLFAGFGPGRSLNFVTAHDGFTLRDLVSYSRRHNHANGEHNRDGHKHEVSDNHGIEGPTTDTAIVADRDRTRRNLVASLLLGQGIPMLVAGDEFGRTQRGNNNPYNQDNETTWIDWSLVEDDREFLAFVQGLAALRRSTPALHRRTFLADGDIEWFGPAGEVDWALGAFGLEYPGALRVLVNLTGESVAFEAVEDWTPAFDTGGTAPIMAPRSLAAYIPTS
jgi:glycogen operon protein